MTVDAAFTFEDPGRQGHRPPSSPTSWPRRRSSRSRRANTPPLFRFPGGSGNAVSIGNRGLMTRLTKIMEDIGCRYFD